MAGSRADAGSDSAGTPAAGVAGDDWAGAGDTGAGVRRAHAEASTPAQAAASAVVRRARWLGIMAARYTLTKTYDKRKLTLPRGGPRFVTLPRPEWNIKKEQPSDSRRRCPSQTRGRSELPDAAGGRVTGGPVQVSVFGKTDLGRTRDHNEDTFLVADLSTGNASLHPEVRRHEVGPRGSLFMVADGMGGAAAGELASAMAADLIYRHLATVWAADEEASAERFAYRMKEAVELANQQIYGYAREHPEVRGMGTTVTAAGVNGHDLYLAQIGDSRAYLVRNGEAIQLTRDQSLMQRLVDAGELTEEEAEQSERRNIILQALGPDPRVKVDLTHQPIRRGDTLIICSDGLSGLVRREEFPAMVQEHAELADLCSALIDRANERGGPDNITVVVAHFEGEGLPEPSAMEDVGYTEYHLPDADPADDEPITVPTAAVAAAPPPTVLGSRGRALLLMAAVLCLIAALLAVWL
jgi:PPM family protein phosphatase